MNFGISSASEVFQETIRNIIQDINGAKNISDDIIIYGESQEEHDKALDKTLKALNDAGLTLNKNKYELNKKKISFFGVVFGPDGISPDPEKVKAVRNTKAPETVKEVRSFLGMTSYCSSFIQNYATICEPLRRLTHQDCEWEWSTEQQIAFDTLKTKLSDETTISYFDPKERETFIVVDASPVGLADILTQDKQVVAYASRALTDVESRYSQTEREALGIVWVACEHFNTDLCGSPHFTVRTDHKPLTSIW